MLLQYLLSFSLSSQTIILCDFLCNVTENVWANESTTVMSDREKNLKVQVWTIKRA